MAIKIYVAFPATYDNGTLYGKWYNLNDYTDEASLLESIEKMISEAPVPSGNGEWRIFDYDSKIKATILEAYTLKNLIVLNQSLSFCNYASDIELVEKMLSNGVKVNELPYKQVNLHFYETFEDYAKEYINENYFTKENKFLIPYVEKLANDLRIESIYYETQKGIYIDYN